MKQSIANDPVKQNKTIEDEEKFPSSTAQAKFTDHRTQAVAQKRLNTMVSDASSNAMQLKNNSSHGGLPSQLQQGIETLSGMSMEHVKVHYNSPKPAQLNAYAYAQGSEIHVAPGQEQHLPHEAWHVVQQAQGRVNPTRQMKAGTPINDDAHLEQEADVMGAKALAIGAYDSDTGTVQARKNSFSPVIQRNTVFKFKTQDLTYDDPANPGTPITEKVGMEAEAWLDPSNPVQGTTTPPRVGVYQDLNLIQGHLVNAHVGGPGRAENFFPFTASLNGQHKNNVELPLKYKMLELHHMQNNVHGWGNRHLYYKVTVVPTNWNAFSAANADQTQLNCEMGYANVNHQIVHTLPLSTFTATDGAHLLHQTLDSELTNIGAGAPGAPTATALGGRHYTLGPTVAVGGIPTRDLFLNGNPIATVEDH